MAASKKEVDTTSSSDNEVVNSTASQETLPPEAGPSRAPQVIDLTDNDNSIEFVSSRKRPRRQSSSGDIEFLSTTSRSATSDHSIPRLVLPSRPAASVVNLTQDDTESGPPRLRSSWSFNNLSGMLARNMPTWSASAATAPIAGPSNLRVVDSPPLQRAIATRPSPSSTTSHRLPWAAAQNVRGGMTRRGRGSFRQPGSLRQSGNLMPGGFSNFMSDDEDDWSAYLTRVYDRIPGLYQSGFSRQSSNYVSPLATTSSITPKFDVNKSHPRKLEKGFRRDIVPPESIIVLDEAEDEEYQDVPICASCKQELFLSATAQTQPVQDEDDDGSRKKPKTARSALARMAAVDPSRAIILRCGHLICALCAAEAKTRKYKRKSPAKRGKGKKKQYPVEVESTEPATAPEIEPWIGCPVDSCDGNNTSWAKPVGDKDGLWQIFL